MDGQTLRNLQESYYTEVYELDEVSQQLKTRAFKNRATREFESDGDNPKDFTKSGASKADQTKANIVKKHGNVAGQHAERAAHAEIFGRKSSSMPKKPFKEGFHLYDVVLSHLLDEGYADTQAAAEAIMANMSEDWRESICEGAYDVYLNRMGVKSKLSDMAKEIYKDPKEKKEDDRKREKRNKTHSVGRDLLNKYIDTMNKDN